MLAYQESFIVLISLQPPHVQHDPVGESRDSVFIRPFVGTSRVKTLAVPDQPIRLMDIAYELSKPVRRTMFQEVRGEAETLAVCGVSGRF